MLGWWIGAASAHVPVIWVAGPADWCDVLAGTIGNDFVMLEPGEYRGPCTFDARPSDIDAELTTLQSLDPGDPAVFVGTDGDHVVRITGRRAIVLAVTFRGLPAGVDAIRLDEPLEAWIRSVTFEDVAGTAVRAAGTQQNVVSSRFVGVGTAIHAACAGAPCATEVSVADNLVVDSLVALEVDALAAVAARDDVYAAVVGIRSAGAVTADGLLVDAGEVALELGAGPAVVTATVARAPVAARTSAGARDVALLGDTLLGALELPGWGPGRGLRLASSATDRPAETGGADVEGTVTCDEPAGCFVDAGALDVYPTEAGPLPAAGIADPAARADWCGYPRQDPPTAGAFETVGPGSYGPLPIAAKRDGGCALRPPDPTDAGHSGVPAADHTGSGAPAPPPPVVRAAAPPGCGCDGAGGGSAGAWAWLVCALVRRARRGADILTPRGETCRTTRP